MYTGGGGLIALAWLKRLVVLKQLWGVAYKCALVTRR